MMKQRKGKEEMQERMKVWMRNKTSGERERKSKKRKTKEKAICEQNKCKSV